MVFCNLLVFAYVHIIRLLVRVVGAEVHVSVHSGFSVVHLGEVLVGIGAKRLRVETAVYSRVTPVHALESATLPGLAFNCWCSISFACDHF